jgi:DNA replication and repair protein RecF
MRLKKLLLENYRLFIKEAFEFNQHSVLVGGNGTGKSSVIEAIRLLSVGKSFRTSRYDECISLTEAYFRLSAVVNDGEDKPLELFYGLPLPEYPEKEKHLTLGGKEVGYLEFLGQFPSVVFTPEDIEIVLGSPQDRRRYLDAVLWQVDKEFRHRQLRLAKALKERSTILFLIKIHRADPEELKPWNEILQELTVEIRTRRVKYLDFLNSYLKKRQDRLIITTKYLEGESDLEKVVPEEIRLAQNLFGPHRDDFEITINGRSGRRFASRGQARTAAVLLKMAEADYLKAKALSAPLILLDDLFSELDETNSQYLLDKIDGDFQVIATSTHDNPQLKDWHQQRLV